jgi:hypothetical protein
LAFGVIALMLYVVGFPVFLLFFVGVLTFFIWKVFSSEGRNETRRIFEFYLSANEILRDDDRRWYGFEIQETIARGEAIVRTMSAAPPLVHFGLGALYQKLDDHSAAVKNLSLVVHEAARDEAAIVFPTRELREYVRMLRKIERSPAEAPMTSSAVRSLERSRKNRGCELLELSRERLAKEVIPLPPSEQKLESVVDMTSYRETEDTRPPVPASFQENGDVSEEIPLKFAIPTKQEKSKDNGTPPAKPERKTISEVLHDIYDQNVQ